MRMAKNLCFVFGLVSSVIWMSCGFCVTGNGNEVVCYGDYTPVKITDSTSSVVINQPPNIYVIHGSMCGDIGNENYQDVLLLEGRARIPGFCNRATIFLNGWKFEFLEDDHHLKDIGAMIYDVVHDIRQGQLTWKTSGRFVDHNPDDPYRFCYTYTILAWNSGTLDIRAHSPSHPCTDTVIDPLQHLRFFNGVSENNASAQMDFYRLFRHTDYIGINNVGVFPQGFGYMIECDDDHHLLQLAYHLDHAENQLNDRRTYVYDSHQDTVFPEGRMLQDSGYVTWISHGLIKDNDMKRESYMGDAVVTVGGPDIRIVSPPFATTPRDEEGFFTACLAGPTHVTEKKEITGIPFQYVIPMLTGWDIQYVCDDQHVREIGVGIENWSYIMPAINAGGTLNYTVSGVLRDNDAFPGLNLSHKVSLLMIRKITPGGGGGPGGGFIQDSLVSDFENPILEQ